MCQVNYALSLHKAFPFLISFKPAAFRCAGAVRTAPTFVSCCFFWAPLVPFVTLLNKQSWDFWLFLFLLEICLSLCFPPRFIFHLLTISFWGGQAVAFLLCRLRHLASKGYFKVTEVSWVMLGSFFKASICLQSNLAVLCILELGILVYKPKLTGIN